MNVLVTGGAGFVGTNLIKRLLKDGHDVTSLDNYLSGFSSNHQDGANYIYGDVRNLTILDNLKYDIVFHLAAIARIQPSFKHPVEYFETNTNGTLNMVQYCIKNDIPLVYAGSSSHHSGKFKNPYTFSKDIGEEIVKLYQEHFNLKASITRFYNVYGPHHLKDGGYSTVIGRWEKQYDDGEPLTIYGDGFKRRDFTHVDDIVDALIKIQNINAWGHIFELGRGYNFSLNEVADMFKEDRLYLDDKPGEAQETLCESRVARFVLDWSPSINLSDYINEYKKRN
jgi:UDP-glucose 4-epimerase